MNDTKDNGLLRLEEVKLPYGMRIALRINYLANHYSESGVRGLKLIEQLGLEEDLLKDMKKTIIKDNYPLRNVGLIMSHVYFLNGLTWEKTSKTLTLLYLITTLPKFRDPYSQSDSGKKWMLHHKDAVKDVIGSHIIGYFIRHGNVRPADPVVEACTFYYGIDLTSSLYHYL